MNDYNKGYEKGREKAFRELLKTLKLIEKQPLYKGKHQTIKFLRERYQREVE